MTTPFPAIYSTISPDALVRDILPGFGVGAIAECRFYSGGFNDTYRVQGADGSIYYLRAYRIQWRTPADIQWELDLLSHLQRKGFPAARPVPYQDGRIFCSVPALEGQRYLALFAEAPGPEISYDDDPAGTAERYGQAVAGMHNALDDFGSAHPRFRKDIEHFVDKPLRNIEPFLAHRPDDWDYLRKFAETVRQRILAMPASALEQGPCARLLKLPMRESLSKKLLPNTKNWAQPSISGA